MEHVIKSPLPGTFYRRSSPEADPYVSEGDVLGAGDVVGLDRDHEDLPRGPERRGRRVARFLVENEDLVDVGQGIIALEPMLADRRCARSSSRTGERSPSA